MGAVEPDQLGYTAPWFGTVSAGGQEQFKYHHQGKIPSVWMKMGEVEVEQPGHGAGGFHLDGAGAGGTYRRIYTLFLVDDPKFVPSGTVRPPWTMEMFRERAAQAGRSRTDKLLLWLPDDPYRPLSQEVWADGSPPATAGPTSRCKGTSRSTNAAHGARRLPRGASGPAEPDRPAAHAGRAGRAAQGRPAPFRRPSLGVRRLRARMARTGRRGRRSSCCAAPNITVPPLNVAGVWLTVDTHGVPPGEYESQVTSAAKELPDIRSR